MKHLTELKLPRFLRRARRALARRTLAALLCAAMLGGGAAVLAADEGDAIPSSNIPAAEVKVADTETKYIYYWRNAHNGGMPTSNSKDTKIPVLIVWNDQYFLRGGSELANRIDNEYPQANGTNCAAAVRKNLDYPSLTFTSNGKDQFIPNKSWPRTWLKGSSNDESDSNYLMSQYGSLQYNCGSSSWNVRNTRENIGYSLYWKDNVIPAEGQGIGGCSMWRPYRHYPMGARGLVKNLPLYNDLTKTGYAVTDGIPEGIPFLLDFGATDGVNHRYAIGWQDDTANGDKAHYLYGAFFVRASYDLDGEANKNPPPSDNNDRWWKTCDWYLNYGDYTPEQFASTNLNISRSSGAGTLPTNKELSQRTWNFSMSTTGQFTIATPGTFHTYYERNYYARNDASGGNCWDQDRVYWLQLVGGGHKLSEVWLWHTPSTDTYGKDWLRTYGDYMESKTPLGAKNSSDYLFDVYVGEPQLCSYFKNSFTVQAGQTMTVDGPVELKEGNTITVEDGGVLSISGWVTNNGVIDIKPGGTMIVQHRESTTGDYQEGLIASAAPAGTKYGAINCDGTLIVMSDATVIGGGLNGLRFGETAQVVNYGTLAAENFTVYRDNTIENRGGASRVFCGWGIKGNGYGLTRTKNDGGSSFIDMGRVESASAVQLAANAVYGPRANAVYINDAGGVTVTQGMANRSGRVTSGGAASGSTTTQKVAAYVVDFDPAEWEKNYFIVPKKVKV